MSTLTRHAAALGRLKGEKAPKARLLPDGRNAAAVALGAAGGRKGGKARAAVLSPAERSEIARMGAEARIKKMGQTRHPKKKK